ncbi:hypothetical protein TWF106_007292 [Orbilia oligospora]|uniref:Uncharacterized protein n=1 Tax=Orbilia oligospora TaxID=2813651 RepID=A0A6G1MEB7_ORBOL|nr:hypothetical protein TWF679_008718 [Orbilia oligospora]KAF3218767.1 hypothetical protein TWF106_007292 [Orbilia oligospora]KAF3230647.1 hypothetical protein TWF191_009558 [Orbilia oligospora]KAF3254028.1 hypothetical protein TWF192_003542 [Orbilia oligospora]
MFSFLRTSRSLWKSRRSQNPELRFYRVTFAPYLSFRQWGRPVVALGMAGGFVYYNSDMLEKSFSKGPFYIPLWFASSKAAPLYEVDGPEHKEYTALMRDSNRRVGAEDVVLHAVKKRVMASPLDMGQWEGFASPFWMTFRLAAPGVTWSRKNLAISFSGIEIVDRPVSNRNLMRFNCIVYPRAAALSMQSTFNSMYSSISQAVWPGEVTTPPKTKPPQKSDSPKKDQQRLDVPLLPSGAIMAIHEAAEKGAITMYKELSRDFQKNAPPPPRGWIVADGTVRLVGTELVLILDFRVAFNPKNFDQHYVYELSPRHHTPRLGMNIHTFEKPGLPPPRPPPKQPQKKPQKKPQKQLQKQQHQIPERDQSPPTQSPPENEPLQKPTVPVEAPDGPPEQQQQRPQGGPRPQQAEQEVPRKR